MKRLVPIGLVALLGVHVAAFAAPPAKSTPPAKSRPAEPPQQEVAYTDLGKYVGKRVNVQTKLKTTRSGTLLKASPFELDIKTDTGAELTIPADSIKRVTVPVPPPDPLFTQPGDSSAKKN